MRCFGNRAISAFSSRTNSAEERVDVCVAISFSLPELLRQGARPHLLNNMYPLPKRMDMRGKSMARHYRYISGDSHLETDSKNWIPRVPAEHRDRAPRLIRTADGADAWLVEGSPLRQNASDIYGGKGRDAWAPYGQRYDETPGTGPAEQRLREQDTDGIDAEVLFPGQQAGPRLWRNITDDAAYRAVVR